MEGALEGGVEGLVAALSKAELEDEDVVERGGADLAGGARGEIEEGASGAGQRGRLGWDGDTAESAKMSGSDVVEGAYRADPVSNRGRRSEMEGDLGRGREEASVVVGLGDLGQLKCKGRSWVSIVKVEETEGGEMGFASLVIRGLVGAGLCGEQSREVKRANGPLVDANGVSRGEQAFVGAQQGGERGGRYGSSAAGEGHSAVMG